MKTVTTDKAPGAIGPYSQGIAAIPSEILFLSGQIGIDPVSGNLVGGGIEEETKQVLANIRAIVEAAGLSVESVVKTTIFLVDLADFQLVNSLYADFFGDHRPARSTVQVSGLPRSARIEIEAIAVRA
jgi:2-iminobutanoate/2-iminopropanoate deaminase